MKSTVNLFNLPDYREQIKAAAMDIAFKNYHLFGKPDLKNTREFVEYLSKTIHDLEEQDEIMRLKVFYIPQIPVGQPKTRH